MPFLHIHLLGDIRTNEEVLRAVRWLDGYGIIFENYDDTTIRRLVDTIRVNCDNTITVYFKGGVEINESLD